VRKEKTDMKSKTAAIILAISALVFGASFDRGRAAEPGGGQMKIGIVSVRKIFNECKRSAAYRDTVGQQRREMEAELDKLNKEIELGKAGLKTLKPDSADYLATMKDVLTKTSSYDAQQKFYQQQLQLGEQRWIEALYQDVIGETANVARAKGLDLVLEKSEPDLPAESGNELTLAISSHKVLYDGGCTDITEEVMAKVDAKAAGEKPQE
jgi:Skp family chaperone for outer membrane proteins